MEKDLQKIIMLMFQPLIQKYPKDFPNTKDLTNLDIWVYSEAFEKHFDYLGLLTKHVPMFWSAKTWHWQEFGRHPNTILYPDDQSCSQITSLWLFFCFLSRSTKFLELMDNAEKSIEQVRPLFISSAPKSSVKIWTSSKTKQQTNKQTKPPSPLILSICWLLWQ